MTTDHALRARQALGANAAGVDFCIELASIPGEAPGPSFVILRLDVDTLTTILRREAAAAADLGIDEMSTVCEPKSWDPQTQFRVRAPKLFTGKGDIWLVADSDSRAGVFSHRIPLTHLVACLSRTQILGPRFRWVGGALLSAESGMDLFAGIVLSRCPEIASRETELQMAARIGAGISSAIGNPSELAAAPPRRRPGV